MVIVCAHCAWVRVSASALLFLFFSPSCLPICCELCMNPPPLSQEECQSVRCQSQLRLPFHLSFLPMTEEGAGGGGGGRTATLPTHTLDTLHFWKQCWSGGKPKRDAFSPVSIRSSDCFMTFAFLLITPACSEDGFWRIIAAQLAVCPNCLSFQIAHPSVFCFVCLFFLTSRRSFGSVHQISFVSPQRTRQLFHRITEEIFCSHFCKCCF